MNFSPEEAIEYAKNKKLKEWVHGFLTTIGKNEELAEIMERSGTLEAPKKISLNKLIRICGPEEGMKYKEEQKDWDKRVDKMTEEIKSDWETPPLIVWRHENGKLTVADGSHRVEALRKAGIKSYWAIIWNKV